MHRFTMRYTTPTIICGPFELEKSMKYRVEANMNRQNCMPFLLSNGKYAEIYLNKMFYEDEK